MGSSAQRGPEAKEAKMNTKAKERIGSREESVALSDRVLVDFPRDVAGLYLPDGHRDAIRVYLNADNGEPVISKSGYIRICAPWLFCGHF